MRVVELKKKLEELGEDVEQLAVAGSKSKTAGGGGSSDEQRIGDIVLDADVAELVVLELGLPPKRLAPVEDLAVQVCDCTVYRVSYFMFIEFALALTHYGFLSTVTYIVYRGAPRSRQSAVLPAPRSPPPPPQMRDRRRSAPSLAPL
jgi:hypothetical protein